MKPLGGDDAAASGVDVGLGGHAEHAAEVVGVGVGVDHGGDRPLAEVLVGQRQARPRRRLDRQRVDDDPARVAGDERDVRDVVPARLPQPVVDLEQAVDVVQLRLAPQARVDRVGIGGALLDERVAADSPTPARRALDHPGRVLGDQAARGALEVTGIHPQLRGAFARRVCVGGVLRKRRHGPSLTSDADRVEPAPYAPAVEAGDHVERCTRRARGGLLRRSRRSATRRQDRRDITCSDHVRRTAAAVRRPVPPGRRGDAARRRAHPRRASGGPSTGST